MPSGYDSIAGLYDRLSRLVFGKSIMHAQQHGLSEIAQGSRVLIVGGGTGHVLEQISLHKQDISVDYVEPSTNMIKKAKVRSVNDLSINYISQPIQELQNDKVYDVVITQFFLDCFEGDELDEIFVQLDNYLRKGGLWIVADFQFSYDWNRRWQKLITSMMYLFFTLTVGIKARKLEDFHQLFKRLDYHLHTKKSYYSSFIFSSVYQKR